VLACRLQVLVAVEDMEEGGLLCLTTLFQFCRYYSLIRRMADSQEAVLEYPSPNAAESLKPEAPLISPDVHPSNVDLLLSMHNGSEAVEDHRRLFGPDEQLPIMSSEQRSSGLDECVICLDKTEDSVLTCCSHALCSDCERRWVRKRLCCPFCRKAFSSVQEAVQAQWQLSVAAVPIEQVLKDVYCLEKKIQSFWRLLLVEKVNRDSLSRILDGNYVQRPRTVESYAAEEIDEFVVIQDLLATVSVQVS
jgi:Zinc finger, C3HC4 type (RING finger)